MTDRTSSPPDRELLEKAAKAAGLAFDAERLHECDVPALWLKKSRMWWNPLTDDGDALRLAVKLQIHLTLTPNYTAASGPSAGVVERGSDPFAATRRAIVRAAAATQEAHP